MEQMKRFAVYYAPEAGPFAEAAARWLGWDAAAGQVVAQPEGAGLDGLAALTQEPRKYGFHGTLKPPFRLAEGVTARDLRAAVVRLAAGLRPVVMPGLEMVDLEGFLAFVPQGDAGGLQTLAAEVVRALEPWRAPLTEAEIARRRPEQLTPRQRELLEIYGYPYVLEEFRFHLTLSGRLTDPERVALAKAATRHFAGRVPQPFVLGALCLFGEDAAGRFHLLDRCPLRA